MKYWGPINSPGGINGNDGYVNGNPGAGIEGSIPTFQLFEQTLRELTNYVIKSGLTPGALLDDTQVAQSSQTGKTIYSLDTGTSDAVVVTLNPQPLTNYTGMVVRFVKGAANTTTTPTFQIAGLPAAALVRRTGAALAVGDLPAGMATEVIYDGTKFRLLGVGAVETQGKGGGYIQNRFYRPPADSVATTEVTFLTAPYTPVNGVNPRIYIATIYHGGYSTATNEQVGSFIRLKRQFGSGSVTLMGNVFGHVGIMNETGQSEWATSTYVHVDEGDAAGQIVNLQLTHETGNPTEEASHVTAAASSLLVLEFGMPIP